MLKPDPAWQMLTLPKDYPPTLCVVVDTEEEFDWNSSFNPESRSITNILSQPFAQEVMDRYGIVPTYVVDYPVANTPESVEVLREIHSEGRCEIGAHLHPWVNPPYGEVINELHSYPGNLPKGIEEQKLTQLTNQIEKSFGSRPTIYKAGRYGVGESTYRILNKLGYQVDTSIVPHTDFSKIQGPDFTSFPDQPFIASHDIIELPHTVDFLGILARVGPTLYPILSSKISKTLNLGSIAAKVHGLERLRLSPEGHSLNDMKRQTRWALDQGHKYFMLSYHSSTLLPGATNYVHDEKDRIRFLSKLDAYFDYFLNRCNGSTLSITEIKNALIKVTK
ncbi:polysaccharide deacetylase family protein [Acidihalobacter aeolianus]|nr:polysaccharide deacetylase family protein [Acidihalobacter aeolianus]